MLWPLFFFIPSQNREAFSFVQLLVYAVVFFKNMNKMFELNYAHNYFVPKGQQQQQQVEDICCICLFRGNSCCNSFASSNISEEILQHNQVSFPRQT